MLHNNSHGVVINCAEIYHLNKVFMDQFLCEAASPGWEMGGGGRYMRERFVEEGFAEGGTSSSL